MSRRANSIAILLVGLGFLLVGTALGQQPEKFRFRMPQEKAFHFETKSGSVAELEAAQWLRAQAEDSSTNTFEFGDQVVLELGPGTRLNTVIGPSLRLSRQVTSNVFILQARGAARAAREASRMALLPGVTASYPVLRQEVSLDGLYAARPNDPHFTPLFAGVVGQWYLENRDTTNGTRLGPDLNIRAAWPMTRGEGITIAIGDTGVEVAHRDLTNRAFGAPHHNFATDSASPLPFMTSSPWAHGTECAGLAAAEMGNGFGMAGVAPEAKLAGWVIFANTSNERLVGDDKLMEMFGFASNTVAVQNHSWTHTGLRQLGLTTLENIGIENAVHGGRGGRGVILVRSAGNDRQQLASANDDGYCSDPRVITVAAVRRNGRVADYSERGSCILVGAPSGDSGGSGLFSTDLLGTTGAMFVGFLPPFVYLSDFVFNSLGFNGTSAAAPQVAGVVALMLSVNTNLTYRDVQQILVLSSRHFDRADPDLKRNGAGLLVSHNDGFGVPDAARAVKLAQAWIPRPAAASITMTNTDGLVSIPDNGFHLSMSGPGIPAGLASIQCVSSAGPHAESSTPLVRLVDLGLGTNSILPDLRGKAALVERGTNNFDEKIIKAAQAGAEFVVIYNFATNNNTAGACPGGNQLCLMGNTEFTPIPAVFIGRDDGLALKAFIATNSSARAQLSLAVSTIRFPVENTLICEYVGVRLQTDHPLRGDLRITLVSPSGTRSVLQQFNSDVTAGPVDWTYWTTHHFLESSAGEWRLELSDESPGAAGNVLSAMLTINGVPIMDLDGDGLDDFWEMSMLGTLETGALDDLDDDGYNNAVEQAMGTDPLLPNEAFRPDLTMWDSKLARVSWPAMEGRTYEILAGTDPARLSVITNVPGLFPETEWFTSILNATNQFFRIREVRP